MCDVRCTVVLHRDRWVTPETVLGHTVQRAQSFVTE